MDLKIRMFVEQDGTIKEVFPWSGAEVAEMQPVFPSNDAGIDWTTVPGTKAIDVYGEWIAQWDRDEIKMRRRLNAIGPVQVLLAAVPGSEYFESLSIEHWAAARDLDHAVKLCGKFIYDHHLTAEQWSGGEVRDLEDRTVARVHYNGRLEELKRVAQARPAADGASSDQFFIMIDDEEA